MSKKSNDKCLTSWLSCLLILFSPVTLWWIHSILFVTELSHRTMNLNIAISYKSSLQQSIVDIELLRTRPISKKCDDGFRRSSAKEFHALNLSTMPINLVPFLNRCKLNKTVFASNHAEWLEMFINSEIGYIHNYKVAGTTIQQSFHDMAKTGKLSGDFVFNQSGDVIRWNRRFLNQSQYFQHREEWYSLMTDIFLFSLVRDPIDRFLSAFYEVNTRNVHLFEIYDIAGLHGMDKMRKLLNALLDSQQLLMDDTVTGIDVKQLWSPEAHFHPQTLFLLNLEFDYFPLDFVGDLKDFEEIIRPILWEFVPYLQRQPKYIDYAMKRYRTRGMEQNEEKQEFDIDRKDLSNSDIAMICDIYWIDYLCFPFEIPEQCNITDLWSRHYGKHIVHNDCYFW